MPEGYTETLQHTFIPQVLDYHVVFQNKSGVIKDFHRGKTMLERDTTDPPFAPPPFPGGGGGIIIIVIV